MFYLKKRVSPTLLFSLWSYRTASTQKPDEQPKIVKLSEQAQRAALAVKIMKTIQESQPQQCIYSPSLREQLIALTNPDSSQDFDKSVKEEFSGMFKEGIKISNQVFRQERIDSACLQERLIFCPNYLVTKQMFRNVNKFPYLLVCGNFGISKTISLALYSLLARHVNLFYYQAECKITDLKKQDNQKVDELQKKFKQQIQELQQKKTLKKLAKYWYWTINRTDIEDKGWRSIQQAFIFQTFQLSPADQEELWKCQSLREFILRLKHYYPQSKVMNKMIIDQVNGLASLMREWNEFLSLKRVQIEKIKELDEESRSLLEEQIKTNQKQYLFPAKELIGFFDQLKKFCNRGYILNSSVNIEKSLFMKPKIPSHQRLFPLKFLKFGLLEPLILPMLGNHDEVNQIQMRYCEDLRQDWGRNDFFHFFWFEVQSFFKQKVPAQKLATAGRIFLSAASTRQGKGFYCALYIKRYLKNEFEKIPANVGKIKAEIQQMPTEKELKSDYSFQQRLLGFFSQQSLQKMFPQVFKAENQVQKALLAKRTSLKATQEHPLATIFGRMFDQFDIQCLKWQKERVKAFMNKGNPEKKLKFLMAVYSLAEQALLEDKQLKFPVSYLGSVIGKDLAAHFLSKQHNQQLLPINRNVNINETVAFLWTPAEFIQLTIEIISPQLYLTHKTLFGSFLLKSNKNQSNFRGNIFQLLFLYQLNPKTVINFKMFASQNWITDHPVLISKSSKFISFNAQIITQLYNQKRQAQKSNQPKVRKLLYLETGMQAEQATNQSAEDNKIKPYDVDLHFQEIIEYCSNNIGCYVSGLPYYKGIFTYNMKCVDFVLAIKKSKEIIIHTFDLTVSTKVEEKIKDAQNFLKNLASQYPRMLRFVHIIIAPQEACKESIQISKNLSIRFSDADSFEMENVTYPSEYQLLKILQETNMKLRQHKARPFS